MSEIRPYFTACAAGLVMACSDSTGSQACSVELSSGHWTRLGLENEWVTALAATPLGLVAGTHDNGVFHLTDNWQSLGLDHAIVSSILFVPGSTERLLVGVMPYSDEQTDAAVFASDDGGHTWFPWDGGLAAAHDRRAWAYSLAMDPGDPDQLYMGLSYPIMRSQDAGRTWQFVRGTESDLDGWSIPALLVSPARDGHVWAGGETALFTAAIVGSSDWGDSWAFVDPTPGNENGVHTLVADSRTTERLFAGLTGVAPGVLRSDDAGLTWEYVLRPKLHGWVYALGQAGDDIYAVTSENFRSPPDGGGVPLTDLGLYRTCDGGQTWDTLPVPQGAGGGQALVVGSQGELLIGTRLGTGGSGVWSLDP